MPTINLGATALPNDVVAGDKRRALRTEKNRQHLAHVFGAVQIEIRVDAKPVKRLEISIATYCLPAHRPDDFRVEHLVKHVTCGYHVFDEAIEELFESYTGEIIIDQNTTWHLGTFRQAVLFVPKGSKNKYAEAGTWSLFQEIVEIDGLSQDFIVPPFLLTISSNKSKNKLNCSLFKASTPSIIKHNSPSHKRAL